MDFVSFIRLISIYIFAFLLELKPSVSCRLDEVRISVLLPYPEPTFAEEQVDEGLELFFCEIHVVAIAAEGSSDGGVSEKHARVSVIGGCVQKT